MCEVNKLNRRGKVFLPFSLGIAHALVVKSRRRSNHDNNTGGNFLLDRWQPHGKEREITSLRYYITHHHHFSASRKYETFFFFF